jgi:hypothetical protein
MLLSSDTGEYGEGRKAKKRMENLKEVIRGLVKPAEDSS